MIRYLPGNTNFMSNIIAETVLIANMKLVILACVSSIFLSVSCKPQISNTSIYDADFIELCIDSTLSLDPATSTAPYLVDFGHIQDLHDSSIKRFLATHTHVRATNLDSLERSDTTWQKYGYFHNPVIKFESIQVHADSIIVKTSKIKAADGSNGTELIFKKTGSSYKCLYAGITWIS